MTELQNRIADLLMDRFHWASLSHEHEELIRERVDKKLTELRQQEYMHDDTLFKIIAAYTGKQIDFFTKLYTKELVDALYDLPYNVRMKMTSELRNTVEQDTSLTEKQRNDITRGTARQLIQIFKEEKDEAELMRHIPQIIEGQINVQHLNF